MQVSTTVLNLVRERAGYACEYCGVMESESGGLLSVDHYRPRNHGGNDDLDNVIYACFRCNQYKANYWPSEPNEIRIWNPREENVTIHLFELDDGRLLAETDVGRESIRRLRLNRAPLVQARLKKRFAMTRNVLIERLTEITLQLAKAQTTRASLAAEENALLLEQRHVLEALRNLDV